jgi:hypothetical protein
MSKAHRCAAFLGLSGPFCIRYRSNCLPRLPRPRAPSLRPSANRRCLLLLPRPTPPLPGKGGADPDEAAATEALRRRTTACATSPFRGHRRRISRAARPPGNRGAGRRGAEADATSSAGASLPRRRRAPPSSGGRRRSKAQVTSSFRAMWDGGGLL